MRPALSRSPFRGLNLQQGMADQGMPHHGLKPLAQRSDEVGRDIGDDDHQIALLFGVAAIAPDDAEDRHAARFRLVDGADQIDRNRRAIW